MNRQKWLISLIFIMIIVVIPCTFWAAAELVKEIEDVGLKTILESIWYGNSEI